jgi:hypothetical protein
VPRIRQGGNVWGRSLIVSAQPGDRANPRFDRGQHPALNHDHLAFREVRPHAILKANLQRLVGTFAQRCFTAWRSDARSASGASASQARPIAAAERRLVKSRVRSSSAAATRPAAADKMLSRRVRFMANLFMRWSIMP